MKLWSGRFTKNTDNLVDKFTASLLWDLRLYRHDIKASIEHVKMLAAQKIIAKEEAEQIEGSLNEIYGEIEAKKLKFKETDEDIHMAIERELIDRIGKVGGKMHTARSRNDQVLTDMKLYIKDEIKNISKLINDLQKVLLKMAQAHKETIMPGYTHLQKAQPILFGHYLMAYFFMFERDKSRLKCCLKRADVMPLGSGALAGTTFNIDRHLVAQKLGFKKISENSLDGVSSRDFLVEFLNALAILGLNFSRLAEDLIIYSSEEFAFIEMSDDYATGSSIMPQKKNADVAELVRGKSGQLIANWVNLTTVLKGLPLAYNRDLQEDKQTTFMAIDTVKAILLVVVKMLPNIIVKKDIMQKAAEESYVNATDLADYLTSKGLAFREAHNLVGTIVKEAIEKGIYLRDIELNQYKKYSLLFSEDVYEYLDVKNSIERHNSVGGTSKNQLEIQIQAASKLIV